MVCQITNEVGQLAIGDAAAKPQTLNGVTQAELNKLTEKVRVQILNNIPSTNHMLINTSWRSIVEWEFDDREQLYKHFAQIKELGQKDIHFHSITRVMMSGKAPLESILALDPAELKRMISRPGPEPILWVLEKVTWETFMKLDFESREDVLRNYQNTLILLSKTTWEKLVGLPKEFRREILQNPQPVTCWMEAGAKFDEIVALSPDDFRSLSERPFKLAILLEGASWSEIIGLDANLRKLVLQKAIPIGTWMSDEKLTWSQCLERIKP